MIKIKINEVIKGEDYYTILFTEGREIYGAIISLVPNAPVHLEFMKFADNKEDIISVTEESMPEEFARMKKDYFDQIMKYIHDKAN